MAILLAVLVVAVLAVGILALLCAELREKLAETTARLEALRIQKAAREGEADYWREKAGKADARCKRLENRCTELVEALHDEEGKDEEVPSE